VGLTSLAETLLDHPADVVVTSGHVGAAAAVTLIVGLSIEWQPRFRIARWAYPAAIFVLGLVLHGTDVPTVPSLAVGLPSAAVLVGVARQLA
jgi:Cys-tRNA synthase (O-phospho-L-seryl-tRNA:Cys-tRNA synthase)